MLKSEALEHFKTNRAIARALGIDESAVSHWGDHVPKLRAYELREVIAREKALAESAPERVHDRAA